MTERGLTSGAKSNSEYSAQLSRRSPVGPLGLGTELVLLLLQVSHCRGGEGGGRQQGPQETKSAAIWDARQITNKWLNVLFPPLPPCPNLPCLWWDKAEMTSCVKPLTARHIMNYASTLIAVRRQKTLLSSSTQRFSISCLIL